VYDVHHAHLEGVPCGRNHDPETAVVAVLFAGQVAVALVSVLAVALWGGTVAAVSFEG